MNTKGTCNNRHSLKRWLISLTKSTFARYQARKNLLCWETVKTASSAEPTSK